MKKTNSDFVKDFFRILEIAMVTNCSNCDLPFTDQEICELREYARRYIELDTPDTGKGKCPYMG